MYICRFIFITLGNTLVLSFEQTFVPISYLKNTLCQVWLKLDFWLWREVLYLIFSQKEESYVTSEVEIEKIVSSKNMKRFFFKTTYIFRLENLRSRPRDLKTLTSSYYYIFLTKK